MLQLTRLLKCLALLALATACGNSTPSIEDTTVAPSDWQLSGAAQATFTIDTRVMHLGGAVAGVTAQVEGQRPVYTLQKKWDVAGGEAWTVSTQLALWSAVGNGTYFIDITATNDAGLAVTQRHAASVTITD
jgi:hypothetical protein